MTPQHECNQERRIERIEIVIDGTAKQLADNNIILTQIRTLLGERILKYDQHIEEGIKFRANMANSMLGIIITITITVFGAVYAYGGLVKQVDVNTSKIWSVK